MVNNVKSVNFVNLDQLQLVNFAACTQRPVMITGEVSHGSPFIKPILNSNIINIRIHLVPQMGPELCKTLEILPGMHGSVCVCMCGIALLKAKMFKVFAIYFSVYLLG